MLTARIPVTTEVAFSQLDQGSSARPPRGTRPEAIPPATAPKQKGTSTEDTVNAAPKTRRTLNLVATLRNAKLLPRSTTPSAAIVSGTNIVSVIDSKASGKPAQVTTKMKISHTWLASQTGPRDRSIAWRGRAPRRASPATRSQKPAPKSAPP